MKLDLLTNAAVVDDAIRFVSRKLNDKVKSVSSDRYEGDKEESNDTDYNEDRDQLEEKQEEEAREVTTTNQIF
jgi:hypothetical protein